MVASDRVANEWVNMGLPVEAEEALWTGVSEYYLGTQQNDGAIIGQIVFGFSDSAAAEQWMGDVQTGQTTILTTNWGELLPQLEPLSASAKGDEQLAYGGNGVYFLFVRYDNVVVTLSVFTQDPRSCGLTPSITLLETLMDSIHGRVY